MVPSNYVLERLREDDEFILYRGRADGAHPASLLLLGPVSAHPALETLNKLTHEYSLRDELGAAWAVRPLALSRYGGQQVLVLEDPGGELLAWLMHGPMEMSRFLRTAIGLTNAVGALHQHQLIHKDLKPSNILVDASSGHSWLTGFGISSRMPRERQTPTPPEFIAGTLSYMAPEQTGRMNRSIDSRSDLYSLGVVLYEMLTGTLPFIASDPMELVHAHIARQPVSPRERSKDVPSAVSAIIMKLLAKTAEDRYQTADGAERDLRRCLTEWDTRARIDDFLLGEHDTPDRLLIPEKLYGRAAEIDTLLAAFDRVVAGGWPELVLVSGYSGIGKSSVVNELHKPLVPPRGLFASGKFDQYKRDIPYATLAQAFQSLLRPLLSKSEAELRMLRTALHEALGPNGQLIVDLVPELKLIIGEQPPVPELPPQDARGRIQTVFRRFINVFARPEHPLALFLDDLQWLDAATLDLLEDLLTRREMKHLLLLGAYRDNEVDSTHPLMRKLHAIRQAGAIVRDIVLGALTREDLQDLIADAVHCQPEDVEPLARLVHDKTGGNPFFAVQFFSALADEELLTFDHRSRRWSWDLSRIHAKGYTENVVELMVGKLTRLPVGTQKALQQLACLGNSATLVLMQLTSEDSIEDVHAHLWEAVRAGLVVRSERAYRFVHDRVQEAAYSLIPEPLHAEMHLRIGRLLAANTPPEDREEKIFEIVNQLNRALHLIASDDEREQVAEFNLMAGRRARASSVYASALTYFIDGAALLPYSTWERRHALMFSLELHRAECEFLTGRLAIAEERLQMLFTRAADTVELSAVATLRMDVYAALDQSDRAVAVCLDYLHHQGIEWSPHPMDEDVEREYEQIWSRLAGREIEELSDLPLMTDPASLATMDVFTRVLPPALFTDANLLSLVICRAVNFSLERGNSDGSCVAYGWLGQIAGPHFGNYKAGFRFGLLGYELVEKRGLTRFQARVHMVLGSHVLPWTKHLRAGRHLIQQTFEIANKIGDLTYAAYSRVNLNTNLLASGEPLADVQREAEAGLDFARQTRIGFAIDVITVQLALIHTLRGSTREFGHFDAGPFEERQYERGLTGSAAQAQRECYYWVRKLYARFLAGEHATAVDASVRAQRLLWSVPSNLEIVDYHYYGALALAASCDAASESPRQQSIDALVAHHRQLEVWAENSPENFESRAALVGAEISRLVGRDLDAMRLYEQAIHSARANGFVHDEAVAYELAARFYAARGFDKIADIYLRDAWYAYLRWGADGKIKQLEQIHPQLRKDPATAGAASAIFTPVERLDLATVINVSQAVSGEMVLERLIDRIMRAAIEQAGAERGVLILPRGDTLRIAAEVTTRGDDVIVQMRDAGASGAALPESLVRYVIRTREPAILDDASRPNPFSADPYIEESRARSILGLPLLHHAQLTGVLYLENTLAPHVFTLERITVLKVLASQAAISLENTRLYHDLAHREARIRRLLDANILGICMWNLDGTIIEANDAFLRMVQYGRADLVSGKVRWPDLTPPEWREREDQALSELKATATVQPHETEVFRKDSSRVPVLAGAALFEPGGSEGVAFVLDLSDQKRAEAEIRALKEQLYRENLALRDEIDRASMFEEIVGSSEALQPVLSRIAKVAPTDSTVLVTGETGTGKELIARAVHKRSRRSRAPFVSVNCAALPPTLISSELFGHEKGAFTGAVQRRLGRFELADGGTIFLDEVGELLPDTQLALLRVLQEREFDRVGGTNTVHVDVRVIAATNRDLEAAVANGNFRQDLFYRLNVFPIEVPPLRERRDDILMLVEYFVERYATRAGKKFRSIDKKTLDLLQGYDWPGNIRELQNVIERSVILSPRDIFSVDPLWISKGSPSPAPHAASSARARQEPRTEREIIEAALAESRGRVSGPSGAAAKLRIPPSTLDHKIRGLKIDKSRFKFG